MTSLVGSIRATCHRLFRRAKQTYQIEMEPMERPGSCMGFFWVPEAFKSWLDGRLFAAILWLWATAKRAIGSNRRWLHRDVRTILTNEIGTLSPGNTRRCDQYFEQIADECHWLHIFKGKSIYHAIIVYHQWRQFNVLLSLRITGSGRFGVALPGIAKCCWEKSPISPDL